LHRGINWDKTSVSSFFLQASKLLTIEQKDFPEGGVGMPLDYTVPHKVIYARDPASQPILLNGAIEGHVSVKNVNKTLPLNKPKLISVFRYDAVTPSSVDIQFSPGYSIGFLSRPDFDILNVIRWYEFPGQIAPNGTLFTGGGSGANAPAYILLHLMRYKSRPTRMVPHCTGTFRPEI